MPKTNLASPRRKRGASEHPRSFHSQATFESDGNSLFGGSAISSIIGHDDPTAVMANVRRSERQAMPSFGTVGTIGSIVTADPSEGRNPTDDSELDNFVNSMQPHDDPLSQKDLRDQLSELDRAEEKWQAKMSLHNNSSGSVSSDDKEVTAKAYVDEAGVSRYLTRKKQAKKEPIRLLVDEENPAKPSQGRSDSPSSQFSDASFRSGVGPSSSTDRSMTSSGSDIGFQRHKKTELGNPSNESETDEIVRQVQKRLIASQDNIVEDGFPIREAESPFSEQRQSRWKSWLTVGDDSERKRPHGDGLATKSDISVDENSNDESKCLPQSRRRRCLILIILLLILCGAILALIFTVGKPKSTPSGLSDRGDLSTGNPTASPTSLVVLEPTATKTEAPTATKTEAPTNHEMANAKLSAISGDLLGDPTTPQYAASQWLENEDPANLDLASLPDKTLEQRYIAALLYFSMDGDNWDRDHGFLTEKSVCEWQDETGKGIRCDSDGSIEDIVINENNLDGPLPFELKELTELKKLELRGNKIVGSIPSDLGELSLLEELDLRQNQLKGTVPESIFKLSQLRTLLLLRNSRLSGTIPPSIEMATNLEMLSFQRCRLTGSLPDSMGKLSLLFFFTMLDNELSGSIPSGLTKLPLLEVLELSGNKLTGSIPDFGNQPDLYFISLFGNQFNGRIPDSVGFLSGLLFLDMRDNELEGPIPSSIGMIPDLVTFFVSKNLLTGSIPSFAGNQGMLQAVNVAENHLSGSIDSFFSEDGPTKRLLTVDFGSNWLSGAIPASVRKFTTLTDLVLKGNDISGPIPVDVGMLSNLDTLSLKENRLDGTIPEEMGRLEKLVVLDLGNNQLRGTIPDTLSMLSSLSVLDLASNDLTGVIPSVLGRLSGLDELRLEKNSLRGDLDSIFCPATNISVPLILDFSADCGLPNPEVVCNCCTLCCEDQYNSCVYN